MLRRCARCRVLVEVAAATTEACPLCATAFEEAPREPDAPEQAFEHTPTSKVPVLVVPPRE